jgi:hypothetical protein
MRRNWIKKKIDLRKEIFFSPQGHRDHGVTQRLSVVFCDLRAPVVKPSLRLLMFIGLEFYFVEGECEGIS